MKWLGLAMLALIVLHHIWNHVWYKGLDKDLDVHLPCSADPFDLPAPAFRDRFSVQRSGLIPIPWISSPLGGAGLGQLTLHLPCAFWSFLLIGLHRVSIGAASWGRCPPHAGLSGLVESADSSSPALMGTALWRPAAFFRSGFRTICSAKPISSHPA